MRIGQDALAHNGEATERRSGKLDEQVVGEVGVLRQHVDRFGYSSDIAPGRLLLRHRGATGAAAQLFPGEE
jgi:hypothetical protein